MASWTYDGTRRGYRDMYQRAQVKPGNDEVLARAFITKVLHPNIWAEYVAAQQRTGVPCVWFAAVHYRESSNDMRGVLHNGEKIVGTNQRTSLVPAGLGPFPTWADSADASIKIKQLDSVEHWTIERMLFEAERFNGLGYVGKNNSSYIWAGTTEEQTGLYVADHVYDPNAEDKRLGVAACLKAFQALGRPDIDALFFYDSGMSSNTGVGGPLVVQQPPVQQIDPIQHLPSVDTGGQSIWQVLPMVFSVLSFIQDLRSKAGKPTDMMSTLNDVMKQAQDTISGVSKTVDAAKAPFYTVADKALVGAGTLAAIPVAVAQSTGHMGTAVFGTEPTTAGLLGVVSAALPVVLGLLGGGSGIGALFTLAKGLFKGTKS